MKHLYTKLSALFLLFLACSNLAQAQQVFPVQVSGTIIPPYSALLSDYSTTRSQDIMYTLTLNDPVEASRDVYFKITVINNGREIMTTDPNYNPVPFQLLQFTPTMVTGTELAAYFQPNNLISLVGGEASTRMPEGFNQICIEVYDFQRRTAISQRSCKGGLVRRLEPPILDLPSCGTSLQVAPFQNIMFRWMPRHLGLPNTPALVEYEFSLVQLSPGIADPNDGFNFALRIFQTTVTTPTFIYNETAPPLENGKTYAWRVRVKDQGGSNLFDNGGYSQICSFTYLEDRSLETIKIGNSACSPLSTEYRLPQSAGFVSEGLNRGEIVQLGFFDLEVTQAFNTGNGYMGLGQIYVSFLKANVKVIFEGLKVDKNNRVYEIGEAKAVGDLIYINSNNLNIKNIRSELTLEMALELDELLKDPIQTNRMVNNRDESDEVPIGLPLVMDNMDEYGNPLPKIAVLDMSFTTKEAKLTAFSWLPTKNPNQPTLFGGTSIGFTPYGINKRGALALFSTTEMELQNGDKIRLKPHRYEERGTQMRLSCEGFEVFNLQGDYFFNKEIFKSVDPAAPIVSIPFSSNGNRLYNFSADLKNLPPFQLASLPNHTFEVGKTYANYSNLEKVETNIYIFNEKSTAEQKSDWTGFTFKENVPSFELSLNETDFRRHLRGGREATSQLLTEVLDLKGAPDLTLKGLQLKGFEIEPSTRSDIYYKMIFNKKKSNVKIANKRFPIEAINVLYVSPYDIYFRAGEIGLELTVKGANDQDLKITIWSGKNEAEVMEVNRIEVDVLKENKLEAAK